MKNISGIFSLACGLLLCVNGFADLPASQEQEQVFTEVMKATEGELRIGDNTAPVVVVEYSSLSCPHCAYYHNDVLPAIKSKYVDAKKVLYIYRDFPMNPAAITAAMVTHCYSAKREKAIGVLLESQSAWAFKPDFQDSLRKIMILGGMSEESFNQCVHNQKLRDKILERSYNAGKLYSITGTPTLFVNGHKLNNVSSLEPIAKLIDSELNKNNNNNKSAGE